jgi:lysophosphatidate acyltransferase
MHYLLAYPLYTLLAFTGLSIALYALSPFVPRASFFARLIAAYLSLLFCAFYGVVVSLLLRPFGLHHSAQYATARAFKYIMLVTCQISMEVEDPENYLGKTRPAVFIGPHQSELDILILGGVFPTHCSVTAKRSLKNIPFLGWFMALSGTVFINRSNSKDARQAMEGAAKTMREWGQSVWMFPEGTRSYASEPELKPFKKGAFHLAVQAGVPVVPVVVANYADILDVKKRRFNAGKVLIKVLKPIETKGLTAADVDDLTRDTREKMLDVMVQLTEKQRGEKVRVAYQTGGDGVVKASGVEATSNVLS